MGKKHLYSISWKQLYPEWDRNVSQLIEDALAISDYREARAVISRIMLL